MKLGLTHPGANVWIEPGDNRRTKLFGAYATSSKMIFPKLYPTERFANISATEPDLDMCAGLDLLIYMSTRLADPVFVKFIKKVKCPIFMVFQRGMNEILDASAERFHSLLAIMRQCDAVLVYDEECLPLVRLCSETPARYWVIPYPIASVLKVMGEYHEQPQFDVVVPYGISVNQQWRGSIPAAMVAGRILREGLFDSAAIFGWRPREAMASDRQILDGMGCRKVELLPMVEIDAYIQILSNARLVINLDRCLSAGKVVVECAITYRPVVMSNRPAYAREIYGGKCQDPWDIAMALRTARLVAEGGWEKQWLVDAANKAAVWSIPNGARCLTDIYKEVVG